RRAEGEEDREPEREDHPRGIPERLEEAREMEAAGLDRQRAQQREFGGEEVGRERRDDVREEEDREERQEQHAEQALDEHRTDLLDRLERDQHAHEEEMDRDP